MILRLSSTAERRILVLVAFSLTAFLSYSSIRNARAVHFVGLHTPEGYDHAARLEPGNARNWVLLGRYWQYNLEDPDTPRAIRAYQTALSLDPRSAETWLDLGAAYESQDALAMARDAYLQAKKAYPLSADVSWRYGNFLLRQDELQPAFAEIRRTVEADPKRAAEAFSRCLHVEPDAEKILDRALPPSRDVYVDVIWDRISDGQTAIALKVWNRLAAIHPKLPLADVFDLVGALRAKGQIAEARRVWDQAVVFAGMTELEGPASSVIWDGGFESGITGGGFAWLLARSLPGVHLSFDTREKHSGNHSLRLTFDGRYNYNFSDVCQYVPVQPSTPYRFSAWVHTRALTSDQGVRFWLGPLSKQDASATLTPDVHGSEPWKRIDALWTSGKDVQEVQICLVRFPSRQVENKIQGTAWVDDVALVPESGENAKP
jgi:hypothetical protein